MMISILFPLFLLFSPLFLSPTFAIQKSYVVYLGGHKHGNQPTEIELNEARNSHYQILSSVVGSPEIAREKIFYSYTHSVNGFSAVLEEEEAAQISKLAGVISVFPNKPKKLHTTRSWEFMRLKRDNRIPPDSIWHKARFGADTIIANLDTGVWPESKSFSDEGYGPVPSRWRGVCQIGQGDKFRCNRKLIGARYFNKGFLAYAGGKLPLNSSYTSPLDHEGHGTHTLSTAGGNFVREASMFGLGNGTASGGSPGARVAAYKVCWPPIDGNECFDSDILAGFDAAIRDGVDVLSVSLGGGAVEFFEDATAIGAFHAVKHGITVVLSAGNDGPGPETVVNTAPWQFTVGASSIDREFSTFVDLGNKKRIKGTSLSESSLSSGRFYPLITAASAKKANVSEEDANLCLPGTLDSKKVKGKIVVCLRGVNARVQKGATALLNGAVGMVLANDEASRTELIADAHVLPTAHISYSDGQIVYAYINSTKNPTAYITPATTELGAKPSPTMAAFSSRGPNSIDPQILKPDITAPGVNILAAYTGADSPTQEAFDQRRVPFNVESGTSMSCPHVSGIVGLLKTLYPHWSPAAIRSALMTTARIRDNTERAIQDEANNKATPFAYGSGHVRPNAAMNPGLVYDLTVYDYLNYLCGRGYNQTLLEAFTEKPYACPKSFNLLNFNYPSISVTKLSRPVTVTRRVKNVGSPGTYKSRVRAPYGVFVTVQPEVLTFKEIGEEKKFTVTFNPWSGVKRKDYEFGVLIWSDGKHYVRSPLAVS